MVDYDGVFDFWIGVLARGRGGEDVGYLAPVVDGRRGMMAGIRGSRWERLGG